MRTKGETIKREEADGATIQPAAGAWVSEARGLIREAVNIVYSFAEAETLNRRGPAIRELAELILSEQNTKDGGKRKCWY